MKRLLVIVLFGLFPVLLMAQEITQPVESKIIDTDTKVTLPGANILIVGSNPLIGASSDIDGNFKLSKVPVGRHTFKVIYIGYEEVYLNEIMTNSILFSLYCNQPFSKGWFNKTNEKIIELTVRL